MTDNVQWETVYKRVCNCYLLNESWKSVLQTYFHFVIKKNESLFLKSYGPCYTYIYIYVVFVLQRRDEFAYNDVYTVRWIVTPVLFICYVCTV